MPEDPEYTYLQKVESLDYARAIRSERARLKRDLKANRLNISQLIMNPPECIISMLVFDLMLAMAYRDRVKFSEALQPCRVDPSETVGGLSFQQRMTIASRLRR